MIDFAPIRFDPPVLQVVGIGWCVVDYQLWVTPEKLTLLGLDEGGEHRGAPPPELAEALKQVKWLSGGSTANMLVSVGGGIPRTMIGCIGLDDPGVGYAKDLRASGVATRLSLSPTDQPTATAIVLFTDGDRTPIGSPGASLEVDIRHVDEDWKGRTLLHCDMHLAGLEEMTKGFRDLFSRVKSNGHVTSMSLGGVGLVRQADLGRVRSLLQLVDVVFGNEKEWRWLLGGEVTAEKMHSLGHRNQVQFRTLGEGGAWMYFRDDAWYERALTVKVVNSVGAGDAFAGRAITDWVLNGLSPATLVAGNAGGAQAVMSPGARPSVTPATTGLDIAM